MGFTLIVIGGPKRPTFISSLAESYLSGVQESKGTAELIHLSDLTFDPVLHEGYRRVQPLEPELIHLQSLMAKADHLVFFYPLWWGSAPANLKGLIDRVILPGFAFKFQKGSAVPEQLFKGKSGEIWMTSDTSLPWWDLLSKRSPTHWLKSTTLEYCGVSPVHVHTLSQVWRLNDAEKARWLARAKASGLRRS